MAGEEAALLLRALNVAANGVYVVEEIANIGQLAAIYTNTRNWTCAADTSADYFRHKEKYPELVADNPETDKEIARYLARACLEMHGVVEGFRRFETALREFPRAARHIGPLGAIFEHARQAKNGS